MNPSDHDALHRRGRALEEAFFKDRDQKLLQVLRRKLAADEARDLLAAATGVADQIVLKELADLEAPQLLAVLGLFPLAEMAWCDGNVTPEERRAVLSAAAEMGVSVESPPHQLLDRWLETRPLAAAESLWVDYVSAICQTLKPATVAKLKDNVMDRARRVAEASGGILGMGNKVSAAEQACLHQLAQAFVLPANP